MTTEGVRIAIVAVAFHAVVAASTADAAKGVKKTTGPNGQRIVSGVVTNMVPNGSGGGTLQVRTASQHRKMGGATATGSNGNQNNNTFNVATATQFHQQNGAIVNGSALHVGSRVRIQALGNEAQHIQILTQNRHNRSMGNVNRHRVNAYQPHQFRRR